MPYLDYTRPDSSSAHKITLCLTEKECMLLLPTVTKALKSAKKNYEKYKDIQDGGEATEKQQDKLCQYEEEYDCLTAVEHQVKKFANRPA